MPAVSSIFSPSATAYALAALAALATGAAAGPGDILWRTSAPTAALGGGVSVSPEGNVYWQTPATWQGTRYGIRAFRPDGAPMFTAPEAGEQYIAFDASGHLYGVHKDGDFVVVALDSETGARQWRTPVPAGVGFLGGVDIGPDGNIYVCSNGGYIEATGSLTSLTPSGGIRWSHKGFFNRGGLASRIVFIDDLVIKVEDTTPVEVGPFGSSAGMYAMEAESGDFAWWLPPHPGGGFHRSPVVNQHLGRVYTTRLGAVWMISPEGELLKAAGRGDALAIDSQGSLYSAVPGAVKMDPNLNIVWQHTSGVPRGWASTPVLSRDESLIAIGYSVAPFMGEDTGHIVVLRTSDGKQVAKIPFLNTTGLSSNVQGLAFSADGSVLFAGIVYGDNWPGEISYYRSELVAIEVANPGLDLAFAAAPPALVPATGAPFEVQIAAAGGRALDASTPTLWFDTGAGWESRALESLGGGRFKGVLPAAACTEPVRYYVAAADTTGEVYTEPRFAPRYFLDALSGESVQSTRLVEESFEGGLPAGWSATGLWHITGACSPGASCDGSASFAYFGIDATCVYRTDPYQREEGSLKLPPVDLSAVPPGGAVDLTFCYNLGADFIHDVPDVRVNGVPAARLAPSASWKPASIDLSEYAGQVVDIEFAMRVHVPAWDPHRGLQVDAVRIEADTIICGACRADLDGDGELTFFDFLTFQDLFAAGDLRADFTGDGVLDFFDFLAFQDAFAAGCP